MMFILNFNTWPIALQIALFCLILASFFSLVFAAFSLVSTSFFYKKYSLNCVLALIVSSVLLLTLKAYTEDFRIFDRVDQFFGLHSSTGGSVFFGFFILFFIINPVVIFGSLLLSDYFISKMEKRSSISVRKPINMLLESFLICVLFPLIGIAMLVALILGQSHCDKGIQDSFHRFNAHLKDVCVEKFGSGECPKTENDLRSFNPAEYDFILQCTRMKYVYDAKTQTYTWMVRHNQSMLISHPNFYPGFGYYEGNKSSSNFLKTFPPDFEGPWDQAPW